MNRLWQPLFAGVVAVVFAAAGMFFYQARSGEAPPDAANLGRMVLAARLMGLDDKIEPFEQWRGKVLVVNFWATWCSPCREEIPGFIEYQERYRSAGVQFVGVAIDQKERVVPYVKEMGINYPIVVGGMETLEFARQLGNNASVLPFTLVVDRSGKVSSALAGIIRPEKLDNLLNPLM